MECIHIDFDVLETNNTKKLMIGDSSKWSTAESEPAYLYITLPASKREKVIDFQKQSVTVFNSLNLGLNVQKTTCKENEYYDLPDGVYKIKLQSIYEEHFCEKYYLKTDIIEKEIAKKIVDNALNKSTNNKAFIDKVFNLDYKIKVAKSFMIEGNVPMTMRYYNEAVDIFKCL